MINQLLIDFEEKYPTKSEREQALRQMTNDQIDELIKATGNTQLKMYLSRFKKQD